MRERPIGDVKALEAIADEVEAGDGPIALVRPGHRPVVLVSAEDWQRLDDLESAESTAWWRRDAAERRMVTGEEADGGEDEPGLGEDEFRRRFAYCRRHVNTDPGAASAFSSGRRNTRSTPVLPGPPLLCPLNPRISANRLTTSQNA
jgi:PHD/YefM family antitoxin component YafN of YafNO toxin-antitoxin module